MSAIIEAYTKTYKSLAIMLGAMWAVFLINTILPMDLNTFGLVPRDVGGLTGIFGMHFLHGNMPHIVGNSSALIILMGLLGLFYQKDAIRICIMGMLLSGALLWVFGRPANHIGASALVYSLSLFIITAGLFEKKILLTILSVFVLITNGTILWSGIFAAPPGVSWDGHLMGAISGILLAWGYGSSKEDPNLVPPSFSDLHNKW